MVHSFHDKLAMKTGPDDPLYPTPCWGNKRQTRGVCLCLQSSEKATVFELALPKMSLVGGREREWRGLAGPRDMGLRGAGCVGRTVS